MKLPNVLLSNYYSVLLKALPLLLITCVCYGQRTKNQPKAPVIQPKAPAIPTPEVTQTLPTDTTISIDINDDLTTQLAPFDELFKLAVAYSPLVKISAENTNSLLATYKLSKVQILQNATGFTNYSTGNQSIITPGAEGQMIGQIANGYRTGVGLNLSLYDLLGRKQLIKQAQANHQSSIHQREAVELQLKRDLITLYQDLLTSQRILKLQLQDERVFLTNFRISEVEYQEGKITSGAFADSRSRYTNVKLQSEQARGEFLKNIYQLEAMIGLPLEQLKRK